jgi:hypothetical protein
VAAEAAAAITVAPVESLRLAKTTATSSRPAVDYGKEQVRFFRDRRLRIQGDQGRGGLGYRFTI